MYIRERQQPDRLAGAAEPASIFDQIKEALVNGHWYLALSLLVLSGERDENKLASQIFYARHPERGGRKLEKGEANFAQLSAEWLDIRDNLVRPVLSKLGPGAPAAGGKPGGKSKSEISIEAGSCVAVERRLHTASAPRLTRVPKSLVYGGRKSIDLDADALAAYEKMVQAARADGIAAPFLKLNSGFRDYDNQANKWKSRLLTKFEKLGCPEASLPCIGHAINRTSAALRSLPIPHSYNAWVDRFVSELAKGGCNPACNARQAVKLLRGGTAPPGRSPHHTGRAIDIHVGGSISTGASNVAYQRKQDAFKWLVCNASRFGFYPYAVEPWHWEYNPPA